MPYMTPPIGADGKTKSAEQMLKESGNPKTPPPENSVVASTPTVDPSKLQKLQYPLDLATTYRHYLQILILKQGRSGYSEATLTRGGYKWDDAAVDKNAAGGIGKQTNVGDQAAPGKTFALEKLGEFTGATAVTGTAAASKTIGSVNTSRKASQAVAYINLYTPDTMQIDLRHDFDKLSVTDALGAAGVVGATGNGTGEASGALAAKSGVLGDSRDVTNLYVASNGYALNPQMEILYKGPNNRQFRYTFKFTPRNAREAAEVESIITTLRFHSCPEYSNLGSSRYFIPPSEFRISHMLDYTYNYSLPRIGQCVLEEVNVNYAAAGHFATFKDGRPIEIQMDLTFTEVNILTKADIQAGF